MMMTSNLAENPLTGRMVLYIFVGFFATVMAVNAAFVTLALSTNTGMVANEPYRKGLKYNERIAADEQQSKLGWTSDISINPRDKTLVATLSDRDGNAVNGLLATIKYGRAVTDREDAVAKLTETAPGHYEANLPGDVTGGYVANLEVFDPKTNAESAIYRARRRLWLKP
jgi:nitrogen fixation protein FixH